jgi:membrane peptidoglycan carboxypeptidase
MQAKLARTGAGETRETGTNRHTDSDSVPTRTESAPAPIMRRQGTDGPSLARRIFRPLAASTRHAQIEAMNRPRADGDAVAHPMPPRPISVLRRLSRLLPVLAAALLVALVAHEIRTSAVQAWAISRYAQRISYTVGSGPSPRVGFPRGGPFDQRRGYTRIPEFRARLASAGLEITSQARVSAELARLVEAGVAPPYPETTVAGLTIHASRGDLLHDATRDQQLFRSFEEIPPIVVKTLLFMEDQDLLQPPDPRSNPVVEWDRLLKVTLLYAGIKMGLPLSVQGGSTLATQLEKFRHSPKGRTDSVGEKLRQVAAASLKSYREGPDTREWRRDLVMAYLNSIPLAAVPGYGEVYGVGNGLHAWFGLPLSSVRDALSDPAGAGAAEAYKHVIALLAALPAPTTYLLRDPTALEARISTYLELLARHGVIDADFARATRATPLRFERPAGAPAATFVSRKAATAIRSDLRRLLGVRDLYELDRLHLAVDTTVDGALQATAAGLLEDLRHDDFIAANGLRDERVLGRADPGTILYSLLLFERTPAGNVLRVQVDTLDQPLDINRGTKLELGSTAKLRALAHYLELVSELHGELAALPRDARAQWAKTARDPITAWAAGVLNEKPTLGVEELLEAALGRRYSASPGETFFTGGSPHTFANYDRTEDGRVMTVKDALAQSTNLVFIRLMRDVVRFHQARLPYDAEEVLSGRDEGARRRLLEAVAEQESKGDLARAYRKYRNLGAEDSIARLLGRHARSPRRLAMLFYAWNPGAPDEELARWLGERIGEPTPAQLRRLVRGYGNPRLTIADYGYLLSRHPLEVWCAGQLVHHPGLAWSDLLARSDEVRRVSSSWLFKGRNRRAQDRRLRIRIEQEAFRRMTPYWRRLGFPFQELVPTYATAIGSSGDRPAALAELMGIIVNDGRRRPTYTLRELRFASGTPYETTFEPVPDPGERVMEVAVARALRATLAGVVERGTARRLHGAFVRADGTPAVVGGKTGTGDNRLRAFRASGTQRSSRVLNRTATFAFFVDERFFGVLTAHVPGEDAAQQRFTSALPVTVLKLLAPKITAGKHPSSKAT